MTARDSNPQYEQMADASMVRCLEAQAQAIWPQESQLIAAYGLAPRTRVIDVGCGTGEFARRLVEAYPCCSVHGIDLIASHLQRARRACAAAGSRVGFAVADAFALPFAAGSFDLAVCRHLLQSVPEPLEVVRELVRVTRPGGRVHLLAEDYAMIHFHPVAPDQDRFWQDGPMRFGRAVGTDLRIGRKVFSILHRLELHEIRLNYVVVDTLRVPRPTFVRIWEAWRDGFSEAIVRHGRFTRDEVDRYWSEMIACLRDPAGYAVWQIPVASAVVPG